MEKQPLISVITTVYNTEKYVERCIESILNQTYPNIELIVVNNASKGKIDEIIGDYQSAYPNRIIKAVKLKKNVGLFHGRMAGAEIATGDYLGFVDSDDRVSLDYYRQLVNCAYEKSADMVASDVILEFSSGGMLYEPLVPFHSFEMELSGADIAKNYWSQEGRCYYWNLVWNKIYSRELFDRALPLLKKMQVPVVMCDDMAYTSVFYSLSTKMAVVPSCQYFYFKRDDAYTSNSPDVDKFNGNIDDIVAVLNYMKFVLTECKLEQYYSNLENWKDRMFRIWCRNISQSHFSSLETKMVQRHLLQAFGKDRLDVTNNIDDTFFYQRNTSFIPFDEIITKKLQEEEIEYVSFDIFDTLLLRPFLDPSDLFSLLGCQLQKELNLTLQIDFTSLRMQAESRAREAVRLNYSYEDVTLDEIYKQLEEFGIIPAHVCQHLKQLEIELEVRYCTSRRYAYNIYKLALQLGKKVICISDMYLPQEVIKQMLKKNGYDSIEHIYVSSNYRQTKHNGTLYKRVLKELNISPAKIIHIGDNHYSDYTVAQRIGMHTLHLPKVKDMWATPAPREIAGSFFSRCFGSQSNVDASGGLRFVGSKCVQAIVANKLFDNPFRNPNPIADFNANPYDFGFALLGPYLLALSKWLYDTVMAEGYDCIHFIARDGFLLKDAFTVLQPLLGSKQVKLNYFYTSRKAMIPLMISSPEDFLTLESVINYSLYSPQKVIELLRPLLDRERYTNAEKICAEKNIDYSTNFQDCFAYRRFMHLLADTFYSQEAINKYRDSMRIYFDKIIGEHDCFFDIGYTGRTESILQKLLNRKIDTHYLHLNKQNGIDNANLNGFKIHAFFDYTPFMPGPIRELLFSDTGPSCVGFSEVAGKIAPVFEKKEETYLQEYLVSNIHRGALDFVTEFKQTFLHDIHSLPYRCYDLVWPLEYYYKNPCCEDLIMFKGVIFEDELFLGKTISAGEYWKSNIGLAPAVPVGVANNLPKWKKAIVLFLTDRRELKKKVSDRFANHPVFLNIIKLPYRAMRACYHLFK